MGQAGSNLKKKNTKNNQDYYFKKSSQEGIKDNLQPKIEYVRKPKKYATEKQLFKIDMPKADNIKNIQELNNENKNVKKSTTSEGRKEADYIFLKVIGRGNFGKVILVKSRLDNCFYALKCLKKIEIAALKCENLIQTEKRVLEKIDHPFIIKLHVTFQTPEKLFMLFDYNNGGELFFHLQKKTRFSEELTRFYAAQLYLALCYLHHNNVLYRDIKPENIILDNMGYIKLIDFGLSKDKFYSDSVTGTLCGTSEYLGKGYVLNL
jgi:tRNA A-37 threonylcarbamoyl transferase component Bud32